MSDCCSDDKDNKKSGGKEKVEYEQAPKSFIGKYLYKIGKKDFENNKNKKKSGCC